MLTPSEMAVLRRAAARKGGNWSKGKKLRYCLENMIIVRKKDKSIAGFAREGYVLTPNGQALFFWGERAQFEAFIEAA